MNKTAIIIIKMLRKLKREYKRNKTHKCQRSANYEQKRIQYRFLSKKKSHCESTKSEIVRLLRKSNRNRKK